MIIILSCLLLIACGALAASAVIISKKPNAAEILAKIAPFQGILGIILLVLGVISLIQILRVIAVFGLAPVIGLITAADMIALGFMLSFSLFGAKADSGLAKINTKLTPFRVPLGFLGIGLGIFYLILIIL